MGKISLKEQRKDCKPNRFGTERQPWDNFHFHRRGFIIMRKENRIQSKAKFSKPSSEGSGLFSNLGCSFATVGPVTSCPLAAPRPGHIPMVCAQGVRDQERGRRKAGMGQLHSRPLPTASKAVEACTPGTAPLE